ncbi:hypothetical protein Tco_0654187 [Tanacetum coccineum]|uniref:Uncharacterized protein n=1 Tax=Tanacetum coccineum TaxID=301880 RepID=A0ABQ4X2V8_9ASTR
MKVFILIGRQVRRKEMTKAENAKNLYVERPVVAFDLLRNALSAIFGLSELKEITFDEELEEPMEDQPLLADASSTALSPGYNVDFDPKEDEEDPKEDPADYPADGGDNYDNESSDDDDVEKDEENKEEEEHLALTDPSAVPTNNPVPSS